MRVLILAAVMMGIIVGLATAFDAYGLFFLADYSLAGPIGTRGDWHPLINLRNNAFLHWRDDSVLTAVASILPVRERVALPLASLLVFSAGFLLLLLRISGHRALLRTALIAVLVPFGLAGVFGWDTVLFASLAWLPYLILCVIACFHGKEAFGIFLVLTAFFSSRLSFSANALAPFMGLLALFIGGYLFRELRPAGRPVFSKALALTAAMILGFSALPFTTSPSVNSQGYPYFTHVVRDDDIGEKVRPLIGPGPKIPYIDRDSIEAYSGPIAVALLLLALGAWLTARRSGSRIASLASGAALLAISLSLLDIYLPERAAFLAPLSAISRIVPGSFAYPLSELAIALAILLIPAACVCCQRILPAVIALSALCLVPAHTSSQRLSRLHFDFASYSPDELRFAVSPSLPVLHTLGPWILRERLRIERTEFLPSDTVPTFVVASHQKPENEAERMFDLNRNTRWSAGRAYQDGSEWLYVRFASPQELSGIELAGGFFKSDFPRALRISTLPECPHEDVDVGMLRSRARELIHYSPWEGSIAFTPFGYPYYTAQTRVQAYFPRITTAECLLVEQTGAISNLDWSVAEFRIGVERDYVIEPSEE